MSSMEQQQNIDELECPVCRCVRGGCHMNMCQAGHQVCAPCHSSLPQPKLCPECRGLYDNPVRHNVVVERFISRTESLVSCGNSACKEVIQGVRMEEHMAECRHRVVPCPFPWCHDKISLDTVSQHMEGHNVIKKTINKKQKLLMNVYKNQASSSWYPFVYEVQGQRFYLQCRQVNRIFRAWVVVEGGREEAAKWRATITVPGPKKNIICESDVFPIDMTPHDIVESGNYFVMIESQLAEFMAGNFIPIKLSLVKV